MSQVITALANQLNSSVFALIIVMIAFIVAIARFYKWLGAAEEKEKGINERMGRTEDKVDTLLELKAKVDVVYDSTQKLEKKVDSLLELKAKVDVVYENTQKLEKKVDTVYENSQRLEAKVDTVHENTESLEQRLSSFYQGKTNRKVAASASPEKLTELGEELAQKFNAHSIVDRIYNDVFGKLYPEGMNDNNAYDIQYRIYGYFSHQIEPHLTEEEKNSFKNEAYQQTMLVEDYYRILAIIFRDRLLKEHNFAISEKGKQGPKVLASAKDKSGVKPQKGTS